MKSCDYNILSLTPSAAQGIAGQGACRICRRFRLGFRFTGTEPPQPFWPGRVNRSTTTPTHANADHVRDLLQGAIRTSAHCSISKDEEITINYGGLADCSDPVWFDAME